MIGAMLPLPLLAPALATTCQNAVVGSYESCIGGIIVLFVNRIPADLSATNSSRVAGDCWVVIPRCANTWPQLCAVGAFVPAVLHSCLCRRHRMDVCGLFGFVACAGSLGVSAAHIRF